MLYPIVVIAGQEPLGVLPSGSQLLAANVSSVSAHTGATSETDVGDDPPASNQGSVVTNSQPQQGGGSLVSSQPILPTVATTHQRPLMSSMPSTANKSVLVAPGLPSVPQKVIDKIKRGEYIDFNELPPARGLSKSLPPHLEGQLVIVQADDLAVSRKLIPNFETWSQCFAIYAAVRIANDPSKAGDLMAYSHSIASMAKKFSWPSWIMYDQAFREEAAYLPARLWGKEDASLYAKCFNWGPTSATPNWCWNCQSLEHQTDQCPHKPSAAKRPRRDGLRPEDPCKKYNNNDGICSYGAKCKFAHKCFSCGGPHPYSRCFRKGKEQARDRRSKQS